MTVKELKEKLIEYPDYMQVHFSMEQPYTIEEMDEEFPEWQKECVINIDIAEWTHGREYYNKKIG